MLGHQATSEAFAVFIAICVWLSIQSWACWRVEKDATT
jgi:hypothetical protein